MIIIIIYLIVSLLLDGLMSNIFPSTISNISPFMTIYVVVALSIIYKYFSSDKKYYILLIIFGFIFDTLYTSTFLVNIIIFLLIGIIIKAFSSILSDNIFMSNIISLIAVISYHFLSFIILNLTLYSSYSFLLLGKVILSSFIMTIIYSSISYLLMGFIMDKRNIKLIK